MKAWLKGGLIGLGIFAIGLISLFIDQSFFGGATTVFDSIYKIIFFMIYLFRALSGEDGTILADFLGIAATPIVYFAIGASIGLIINNIKSKS